ncbi:MAG: D-alanyl-D-alanine carboxypeptidase family protein [Pseudomonadota bacterium]
MRLVLIILTLLGHAAAEDAADRAVIETDARQAIIVDFETGKTLFAKNADVPLPPASMSKLMTLAIVFEKLERGELKLDQEFTVTKNAYRFGGSTMFLRLGSKVSVENLLRGVIVQSGNDAAIALAEGVSGSEADFVELMNRKATEWGLANSSFGNATGWPHPDQKMSARDLATLARRIIARHPDLYDIFDEPRFTWDGVAQDNRNPLLFDGGPGDGLKTGHTDEAGYCLVGSGVQDGVRRIFVIGGLDSDSARAEEARRMMRVALTDFKTIEFFLAGDVAGSAPVARGAKNTVPLILAADVSAIVHRRLAGETKAYLVYDSPLIAPIASGAPIASLRLEVPGAPPEIYPVVAGASIEETGFGGKVILGLKRVIGGAPEAPDRVEERLGGDMDPLILNSTAS